MFESFPAEAEPDGAVFGPHHFYLGVLLILLVCWMVYDADTDSRPWAVVGLTLLAVFAFSLTWPYYPAVGAFGLLVVLGVATAVAIVRPYWWRIGLGARAALFVGLFTAWDDALSHALGWWTPLDAVWGRYLYPYVSDPYVPSGVRIPEGLGRLLDLEALLLQQVADALAVVAL